MVETVVGQERSATGRVSSAQGVAATSTQRRPAWEASLGYIAQFTCCYDTTAGITFAGTHQGFELGLALLLGDASRPFRWVTELRFAYLPAGFAMDTASSTRMGTESWHSLQAAWLAGFRLRAGAFFAQLHLGPDITSNGAGTEIPTWTRFALRTGARLGIGGRRRLRPQLYGGYDFVVATDGSLNHLPTVGASLPW